MRQKWLVNITVATVDIETISRKAMLVVHGARSLRDLVIIYLGDSTIIGDLSDVSSTE